MTVSHQATSYYTDVGEPKFCPYSWVACVFFILEAILPVQGQDFALDPYYLFWDIVYNTRFLSPNSANALCTFSLIPPSIPLASFTWRCLVRVLQCSHTAAEAEGA